jgi:hypothetical protein
MGTYIKKFEGGQSTTQTSTDKTTQGFTQRGGGGNRGEPPQKQNLKNQKLKKKF